MFHHSLVYMISLYYLCYLHKFDALPPPKYPPEDLLERYTCNGCIPVAHFFVDDTNNGNSTHFQFSHASISSFIRGAEKIDNIISRMLLHSKSSSINNNNANINDYPILSLPKDQWIHYAINKYARYFHGAKVAVFGSMEPWAEAAALYAGAREVVTVEYNLLTYNYSNNAGSSNNNTSTSTTTSSRTISTLRTVSSAGFDAFYRDEVSSFDIALSASSFDHDGLGRYGDPLNPDADLEAMAKARSILKPGGLLFLTVPVGPDVLVFNLHRRYGPARLPLLLGLDRAERSMLLSAAALVAQSDDDCMCGGDGRDAADGDGSCGGTPTDIGNEASECSPQHPGDDNNVVTEPSLSSTSSIPERKKKEKWTLLDKIGWVEARLTQPANWRQSYEPIFVLQRQAETSLT